MPASPSLSGFDVAMYARCRPVNREIRGKGGHFTPTREIKRHVRALALDHPEGWKLQGRVSPITRDRQSMWSSLVKQCLLRMMYWCMLCSKEKFTQCWMETNNVVHIIDWCTFTYPLREHPLAGSADPPALKGPMIATQDGRPAESVVVRLWWQLSTPQGSRT